MAISVAWQTVASVTNTAGQLYTIPSASTASFGSYARDLVLTNSGTATIFVGFSGSGTVATSVASFQVPTGGTVLLTQCQVPASAVVSALTGVSGQTATLSIGYASNVNFF